MSNLFPEGVNRVQEFLFSKSSKSEIQLLPESTATAQEAAHTLNVQLYSIGKSIVLGNEINTVVAVVCGNLKVDIGKLSKELSISNLKPLKADEVKKRTNFVIGGVSPFALPLKTIIVIDFHLYKLDFCYVAAGHPKAVVRTSGKEIVTLTKSKVLSICIDQLAK